MTGGLPPGVFGGCHQKILWHTISRCRDNVNIVLTLDRLQQLRLIKPEAWTGNWSVLHRMDSVEWLELVLHIPTWNIGVEHVIPVFPHGGGSQAGWGGCWTAWCGDEQSLLWSPRTELFQKYVCEL